MEEREDMSEKEKERGDKEEGNPLYPLKYWKTLLLLAGLDEEEEQQDDYNVGVYKILPYPPHTKDPNEFFIERT